MSSNDKINFNINRLIEVLRTMATCQKEYGISEENLEKIKDMIVKSVNGPLNTIEYRNDNNLIRLTWDPEVKQFISYYQYYYTLSFEKTCVQLRTFLEYNCDYICTTHNMVYYNSGIHKDTKTIFNKALCAQLSNENNFIRNFVRNNNNVSISIRESAFYEYKKTADKYKWESRITEAYNPRGSIKLMMENLIDKYKHVYHLDT